MYKFINGIEGNHVDSVDAILMLEKKYSITFPNVLKEYYLKYDGEKIKLTTFIIDGYECEVTKIVPIMADSMNFENITDNDKRDGFIPNIFYPLARDRGGNYYYWSSVSEKVFLVFVDDFENPFKICDTVEEFFEILENGNVLIKQS